MTTANSLLERLGQVPGLKRRRVRMWAILVSLIVVVLGVQAIWPQARFMPNLAADLGPAQILAVFLAALVCEYVDSALGMGYGTTLTPLLMLAGFDPLRIVPCVLISEFLTGATAGLMHHRDGNVDLLGDKHARLTVVLLSVLSTVGAVAAVLVTIHLPKVWLKGLIGAIIMAMGLVIVATFRRQLRYRPAHIIGLGAVAAFNKGVSGGGYGPLVTAGQVVSGLPAKHAVAITSLAESFTCLVALIAFYFLSGLPDLALAVPLTVGAMLSVPVATLTVKWMPETTMRVCVGVMTLLLGGMTLVKLIW